MSISRAITGYFDEPLRFKLKDKDHTLGSVTLPVSRLGTSPSKVWLPLQPHKRASEAHGSLLLSCWVTNNSTTSGTRTLASDCKDAVPGINQEHDVDEARKYNDTWYPILLVDTSAGQTHTRSNRSKSK